MTSNDCNVWVTSALSAPPLCKSLWGHLKYLSWSTVRTITRAALQTRQNIFTAALDVWLKLYTCKKFHLFWKGIQLAQIHKEQSRMLGRNLQDIQVVPKIPNPLLRSVRGVCCFWSFSSTVHTEKKTSAEMLLFLHSWNLQMHVQVSWMVHIYIMAMSFCKTPLHLSW